jgi:signal transduction histidine kinase
MPQEALKRLDRVKGRLLSHLIWIRSRIHRLGDLGLRERFLLLLGSVLLGVLLLLGLDMLRQRRLFFEEVRRHVCEEAEGLAVLLPDRPGPEALRRLAEVLDRIDRYGVPHQVFLLSPEGQVRLSDVRAFEVGDLPELALGRPKALPFFQVMRHGALWVASCTVATPGGDLLHLAEPLPQLEHYLRALILERVRLLLILSAIFFLVVPLALHRWVLHPLRQTLRALGAIGHGALELRLPLHSRSEWGQIARAMAASVQALAESRAALEQERSRLAFLYRAGRELAASTDWPAVAESALDLAMEAAGAQAGLFLLWDPATGHLSLACERGIPDAMREALQLRLMNPRTSARCMQCVPRSARIGEACPLLPVGPARAAGWTSLACVHLAYGDQTLGFIILYLERESLSAERRELLQSLADEIAAAIAAARMAAWEKAIRSEMAHMAPAWSTLEDALVSPLSQVIEGCRMVWGAVVLLEDPAPRLVAGWNLPAPPAAILDALRGAGRPSDSLEACPTPWGWAHWIPMQVDGERLGGLVLGHPARPGLSPLERRLAQAAAQAMAHWLFQARQTHRWVEAALWEERQRLARELHDDVAQHLAYLHIKAQKAERLWNRPNVEVLLPALLREIREDIRDLYTEVRLALEGLRATPGPGETLAEALRRLIASRSIQGEVEMDVEIGELPPLTPWEEAHLLRIAQEALANAYRHAHARRIRLSLRHEQGEITLEIVDDGVGFDPNVLPSHSFGLRMMRERAERLGGVLEVRSTPGHGTRVCLRWRRGGPPGPPHG